MGSDWSRGSLIEFTGSNVENLWAVYIGQDNQGNYYVVYLSEGEVRSGLLQDVAAGRPYKVNNKYNRYVYPLSPRQIVENALREVGKKYENMGSEKFAALMRHGSSSEALFLDVGDIIKFNIQWTPLWGVYLGHGIVVYFDGNEVRTMVLPDGYPYKVNNQYDHKVKPRSPDEIVANAQKEVGKTYGNSEANSESFAAKLRYGISLEGPFPEPGDLIEYLRGFYEHWAVFESDLNVIHLTGTGIEALSLSASQGVANASSALDSTAEVKRDHMEHVGNGSRYKVNNKYDQRKKPFSPYQIVQNAKSKVGQMRWYHALKANCEHFATSCRYGEGLCEQIGKALAVGTAAAAGGAGVLYISGTVLKHFS